MAGNGPPPTPTKILEARGSLRAAARKGEFTPAPGEPDKPDSLTYEAGLVWDGLVPTLAKTGILAKIDASKLARYCDVLVRWHKVRDLIEQVGYLYTAERVKPGPDGKPFVEKLVKRFPAVSMYNELGLHLDRLEAQFGIGPANRARILAPVLGGAGVSEPSSADKKRFLRLA